ncbi:MAG: hypothetical protein ABGX05_08420, partial [Pirellulaceae bacterium]
PADRDDFGGFQASSGIDVGSSHESGAGDPDTDLCGHGVSPVTDGEGKWAFFFYWTDTIHRGDLDFSTECVEMVAGQFSRMFCQR